MPVAYRIVSAAVAVVAAEDMSLKVAFVAEASSVAAAAVLAQNFQD